MARPTEKTPSVVARIEAALKGGNRRMASAAFGGVSYDSFRRWMADDEGFREMVEDAEAEAEVANVLNIEKAGAAGNWQASAWWLERRYKEDWQRPTPLQRHEHMGKDGGPIRQEGVWRLSFGDENHTIIEAAAAAREIEDGECPELE